MQTPFGELPDTARIWIYQSNRPFEQKEKENISVILSSFLEKWTAHGNTLRAAFDLPFNHFIIVGLDEGFSGASGCSVDALFRTIQTIGKETGIDFFNRNLIAFKKQNEVVQVSLQQLKNGEIQWNKESLIFNNLITTKAELQTSWIVYAKDSWLSRYAKL